MRVRDMTLTIPTASLSVTRRTPQGTPSRRREVTQAAAPASGTCRNLSADRLAREAAGHRDLREPSFGDEGTQLPREQVPLLDAARVHEVVALEVEVGDVEALAFWIPATLFEHVVGSAIDRA